jgi:hypothetical protein
MAAMLAASNNRKVKATASTDALDMTLLVDPTIIPPEKEWEFNIELGMLMLNG